MKADVHKKVVEIIRRVAEENSIDIAETVNIGDNLNSGVGLSSLEIAELVSELEAEFGVDPFEEQFSITDVVTVADLVSVYEAMLFGVPEDDSDQLSEALDNIINA